MPIRGVGRVRVGVALAGVAGAAVAAFTRPFTPAADAVVAVAVIGMVVAASVQPWHETEGATPIGRVSWAWGVLLLAGAACELREYVSRPRSLHPTLSSMLNTLDRGSPGRFVVFGAWLALGSWLAVR